MTQAPATIDYRSPGTGGPPLPPGMIVYGVVLCLMAAAAGCFAAATPLALLVPQPPGQPRAFEPAQLVTAAVLYVVACAGLVVLAVGCFRGRRWTVPVVLGLAWPALVYAAAFVPITAAATALSEPTPGMTPQTQLAMAVGTGVFGLLLGVGLPLAFVLYFRRPSLHERLAVRQPEAGRVASQPARTVGLWLWLGIVAATTLMNLPRPRWSLFGTVLSGLPAAIVLLLVAGAFAFCAVLVYRRDPRGGWLAAGLVLLIAASIAVTVAVLGGPAVAAANVAPAARPQVEANPMSGTAAQLALSTLGGLASAAAILWANRATLLMPESDAR